VAYRDQTTAGKDAVKILNLTITDKIYTSNVYLVTGTRNSIDDVNTLVDVGRDPSVIGRISRASTGVGKKRVAQVVLTHSHYDHASLLPDIRKLFTPTVCAFSRSLAGVDRLLADGDMLKIGDRVFEVIHTPGHSTDSICLYCNKEKVLFVGDSPVVGLRANGSYGEDFGDTLERLHAKDVRSIYFGHGDPVLEDGNKLIQASLLNVRKALSA